jgi:hypothetical protein
VRGTIEGEDVPREVLEDGGTPREGGDVVDDVMRCRGLNREGAEGPVSRFSELQLADLVTHDDRVHRFGDGDELHFAVQGDEWQAVLIGSAHQRIRQRLETATEFEDDPGCLGARKVGDVSHESGVGLGKRDAGREDQLAPLKERSNVGKFADVGPAHMSLKSLRACLYGRATCSNFWQREDVGDGWPFGLNDIGRQHFSDGPRFHKIRV